MVGASRLVMVLGGTYETCETCGTASRIAGCSVWDCFGCAGVCFSQCSEWANTGAERGILSAFEIYATVGALLLDFIVPIIL